MTKHTNWEMSTTVACRLTHHSLTHSLSLSLYIYNSSPGRQRVEQNPLDTKTTKQMWFVLHSGKFSTTTQRTISTEMLYPPRGSEPFVARCHTRCDHGQSQWTSWLKEHPLPPYYLVELRYYIYTKTSDMQGMKCGEPEHPTRLEEVDASIDRFTHTILKYPTNRLFWACLLRGFHCT